MTDLVKRASVKLGLELARSLREGGGTPVEADPSLNEASRRVVQAMRKKYDDAWLGEFNPSVKGVPIQKDLLWKWDGRDVLNFEASFVVPKYDQLLVRMLLDRLTAKYTGTKDDAVRITAIQNRIRDLDGELLAWS